LGRVAETSLDYQTELTDPPVCATITYERRKHMEEQIKGICDALENIEYNTRCLGEWPSDVESEIHNISWNTQRIATALETMTEHLIKKKA